MGGLDKHTENCTYLDIFARTQVLASTDAASLIGQCSATFIFLWSCQDPLLTIYNATYFCLERVSNTHKMTLDSKYQHNLQKPNEHSVQRPNEQNVQKPNEYESTE